MSPKNRKFHLVAVAIAALFSAVLFWINQRHYLTFHLHGPDAAPFYQGMWNTLHGNIMFTTLNDDRSVLSYHFTPYFILLSPLLLIWEDIRILFLVQIIGFAVAGLLLYWVVWRADRPKIALALLVAFYLNPTLHQIAYNELRRITHAVPYIILTLVAIHLKRRWLMVFALLLALSCKENVSVFVFMVGVYLILFERDWKWGLPLAILGIGWALLIPTVVIPALTPPDVPYGGLSEFAYLGDSPSEIVIGVLQNPRHVLAYTFDGAARRALWQFLLPLGLFLPFLAPRWVIIGIPSLLLLLMSGNPRLHQLEDWYLAAVLPVFFVGITVAFIDQPRRIAKMLTVWLMITTLVGYALYSYMPLGGRSDFIFYERTTHHAVVDEILGQLPENAIVATQTGFQPHIANRPRLYTYPWYSQQQAASIGYYFFDRHANPYPFDALQLGYEIDNVVTDVDNVVVAEGDGVYLIGRNLPQLPAYPQNKIAEASIKLTRVEVAVADSQGIFVNTTANPIQLKPNDQLRVTLYWEAVAKPVGERTVSVRVSDDVTGALLAQKDAQPSGGGRATSVWETGWQFRDTYYLTVDSHEGITTASLDILLYDSFTQERIPFGDEETIEITAIVLEP